MNRTLLHKKTLAAFLAVIGILAFAFPVKLYAAEEAGITVPFYTTGFGDVEFTFPYSDSCFEQPSSVFSRDLAKASMGLLASAFRKHKDSRLANQYETYLSGAGFRDIYAFGYDRPTSRDTLSGVIAQKKIGDFTLIAASPAGQGYEKEWGGNLEVGTGVRHEGFDRGAQVLEKEVYQYISDHAVTGKVKIWITGFSRAAAVSNLAAADFLESGQFADVYAYLFAVPRTTKEPADYPGIYNICGQYDPVPMVPLQSWGYERYGQDLYTPAVESDLEYLNKMARANVTSVKITDDYFRYNPELNYQIRLIAEFLGELFPDNEEYAEKMQEDVLRIWQVADPDNIPNILRKVFSQLEDLDTRQEAGSRAFLDYLSYIVSLRVRDNEGSEELRDTYWEQEQGLAANIMREHLPYIYMSWVFSELSDEEVFHGRKDTRRVYVLGKAEVDVWLDGYYITGVDQNGRHTFSPEGSKVPDEEFMDHNYSVFIVRNGLETMACLPPGAPFQLRIRTPQREDLIYYTVECSPETTFGNVSEMNVSVVTPGEYVLDFPADGSHGSLEAVSGEIRRQGTVPVANSPTTVMRVESASNSHFTIARLLTGATFLVLYVLIILVFCLVIFIIHRIRRKEHGPYSPWYVVLPHLLLIIPFTALTEYVTVNFYAIAAVRTGCAAATMLVIFLLTLRGFLRNRNLPNLFIMLGILAAGFGNVFLYQKSPLAGAQAYKIILYCVLSAVLTWLAVFTFRRRKA